MKSADSITQAAPDVLEPSGALSLPAELVAELFRDAQAAEVGFDIDAFAALLVQIAGKYLPQRAVDSEAADFCERLHVGELALARACAAGNEEAWNRFLTRYRQSIYRSALAVTSGDESARELGDSIYADLYGLGTREGERQSKLAYYDGRGSLDGWLRSVLAHEHLNRWRGAKRLVSLEEQVEAGSQFKAPDAASDSAADARLVSATDEVLAAISAEERYLLASYYLDGQTLAEIAGCLGVHESTISRRLDRVTGALNREILKGLKRRGMSRDQAREALETDVRDLTVDVRRHLATARSQSESVLTEGAKESQ